MSLKIGDVSLEYGLMLAPMAGYTDRAMRRICRELGAEYLVSEMVSAKALVYQDRKSAPLARVLADELPCAVQLFGSEPEILAEAARIVSGGMQGGVPPSAIDLNFGCPVRKITGNGEGSALMKTPRRIEEITAAVARATALPVTVKLRAGWDGESRNAAECARAAEAGGAALICVHGRTRNELYAGNADLGIIGEVVRAVSVPVVGNGDVRDAHSARWMLEETGCAALMIGRGAVGNPFVFREIRAGLAGKDCAPPTLRERIETGLRQLSYAILDKGEETAVLESRKALAAYIVGVRGAAAIRARIHEAGSEAELREIALTFLRDSDGERRESGISIALRTGKDEDSR